MTGVVEKYPGELAHLRFVVANLEEALATTRLARDAASQGHHVMFGLWCREVRPGWRMWRIKRRAEALERMSG